MNCPIIIHNLTQHYPENHLTAYNFCVKNNSQNELTMKRKYGMICCFTPKDKSVLEADFNIRRCYFGKLFYNLSVSEVNEW